jgi:hypothetical protein
MPPHRKAIKRCVQVQTFKVKYIFLISILIANHLFGQSLADKTNSQLIQSQRIGDSLIRTTMLTGLLLFNDTANVYGPVDEDRLLSYVRLTRYYFDSKRNLRYVFTTKPDRTEDSYFYLDGRLVAARITLRQREKDLPITTTFYFTSADHNATIEEIRNGISIGSLNKDIYFTLIDGMNFQQKFKMLVQ